MKWPVCFHFQQALAQAKINIHWQLMNFFTRLGLFSVFKIFTLLVKTLTVITTKRKCQVCLEKSLIYFFSVQLNPWDFNVFFSTWSPSVLSRRGGNKPEHLQLTKKLVIPKEFLFYMHLLIAMEKVMCGCCSYRLKNFYICLYFSHL